MMSVCYAMPIVQEEPYSISNTLRKSKDGLVDKKYLEEGRESRLDKASATVFDLPVRKFS